MLLGLCIVLIASAIASRLPNYLQSDDDFRFVAYHDLLTTAKRFSDHNVTNYSHMLYDEEKNAIVLGARNRIYRLSPELELLQRIEWEVPESVLSLCLAKGQSENDCQNYIMSIHIYQQKLLICSTYAFSPKCTWTTTELKKIKEESSAGKSPFNPNSSITTIVTSDGKMFIGTTLDFSNTDSAIIRTDLSSENSKILRTRQYNDVELLEPVFVGSFESGEFLYFVFREISIEILNSNSESKEIIPRIARVCKNDSGGVHILKENWTSFLKARLNCSIPGGNFPFYFGIVQDISYLPDEGELYAVFSTQENSIHGSAICVYNMSSIEKTFNGPTIYQEIVSGTPIWKTMKPQNESFACKGPQRSSSNLLDSSKYKLMKNAVQPMHLNPLYLEKLEIFTKIVATKVATKLHENVPVIFVANREGYVKKISVLPRTKQTCLIEILELEKGILKIETMEFLKDSQSLYVGTSNSFYQIPSQRCARFVSRISCLNAMDPYCGWNDLGQKCSLAPHADPLISHFYQNATTCPILSTPVDGSFSAWSPWFKCAKSGEDDLITGDELSSNIDTCQCRTRSCDNPVPKNGGVGCSGKGYSIMVANCTQNGGWSEWTSWSACSQTCGIAIKVRRRTCTNPRPLFGGRICVGLDRQEIYCTDLPPCPVPVPFSISGGWGPFGDWSECSAICGGGFKFRQRKCDDPIPENGGLECTGCNIEYDQCNKQPCIEIKKLGPFTPWLLINNSENGYIEKRFRYQCKATALQDPSGLRISLYKEETRSCNDIVGCYRISENSQKSHSSNSGCFSDWSECSVKSGVGRRVRKILSETECEGLGFQEEICEMPSCDSPEASETNFCTPVSEEKVFISSSISIHWIVTILMVFGLFCTILTYFSTKYVLEHKFNRLRRIQGSPHYLSSSFPNQYSSVPLKDFSENNKPKRQSSFNSSKQSYLNKSNHNLLNQNTPKIFKFQNDTDCSTLKRNSALNNMRLKAMDDDMDKY